MDAAQWTSQVIGVVKEAEITRQSEKRLKACKDQSPNCPRCNSTNTKFCYYNNYSRTQPRYFCKTCRRYWTEGGSLRNVPVGGCSRKNKRSSLSSLANSSSSTTTSTTTTTTTTSLVSSSMNLQPNQLISTLQFPLATTKLYQVAGQDLKFSFPTQQGLAHYDHISGIGGGGGGSISGFEMLRSGVSPKGFAPFVAAPGPVFGGEFGFQELMRQSNLKLPLDHHGGFSGSNIGRPLFPFEDLKQVHVRNEEDENRVVQGEGEGDLFWNGGNNGRGGGTW